MTKRASDLLATVALVLGLAAPCSARAEDPVDRETARRSFEEGKRRRDAGDTQGALESFLAADALMNVPTTKLAVARALAALGRLVEARDAALNVARLPAAPSEPQPFADARAGAAQLAVNLGERIPALTIALTGARPASLAVDGVTIPEPAWTVARRLDPGRHVVIVKLGDQETSEEVVLEEREQKSVPLLLSVTSPRREVASPRKQPRAEERRPLGALFWGGAGLTVVGLGVGAASGALSMASAADAEALCRNGKCPPAAHGSLDDANRTATISTAAFVAAGVGAVLAATGLVGRF